MSITQERMIQLINAGQDYKQAFDKLCQRLDELRDQIAAKAITGAEAFDIAWRSAGVGLLTQPVMSQATLIVEYKHFKANMKRNERAKKKQKFKREMAGVEPRASASDPFLHAAKRQRPAALVMPDPSMSEDLELQGPVLPTASESAESAGIDTQAIELEVEAAYQRQLKRERIRKELGIVKNQPAEAADTSKDEPNDSE